MKNFNRFIFSFLFITILLVSFSYASFNTELYVLGTGVVRANADVRVIGVQNSGYNGTAIENFRPNFDVDRTNMSVDLPDSSDYITYEVTIKNYGDAVFIPQIDVLSEVSNNVLISISDGTISYNLPNNNINYGLTTNQEKTFTITISNKNGTTNEDIVVSLQYHFVHDTVTTPTIQSNTQDRRIELVTPGTSTFAVDHYEYYTTCSNASSATPPTANSSATGIVSSNGQLDYDSINCGTSTTWYRTVSTKGIKSVWSNGVEVIKGLSITYNTHGGSACPETPGVYGQTWGTLCETSKTGWTFVEWNTEPDGSGATITSSSIAETNLIVHAIWNINYYTLTYDSNNGSTCSEPGVTKAYQSIWGELCEPQRTGWTFAGWYYNNEEVTELSTATSNITVVAQWTANDISLSNKTITKTYSADSQTDSIDSATNGTGSYVYTITAGNTNNYFSITNTTLNIISKIPVGTYTLTIHATDNETNKTDTAAYTISINPKELSASITSCNDKDYDETTTANCLLDIQTLETGDNVTVSGTCVFDDENVGINKIVTCNNFTLSGNDSNNYIVQTNSLTSTASISKINNPLTVTANSPLTYTGAAQILVTTSSAVTTVYYSTENDLTTGNCDSTRGSVNIPTAVDAGNYTVYYCSEGDTNYNGTTGSVYVSIGRATVDFPICTSKVYTGNEQTLFPAHSIGEYTNTELNGINVNSYTVSLTPASNYEWSSGENKESARALTCQITKSDTTTTLQNQNKTYDGNPQSASGATSTLNSSNNTISGGSWTFKYYDNTSCSGEERSSAPTNVGTYGVTATLTANDNYNSSSSNCATLTIDYLNVNVSFDRNCPTTGSGGQTSDVTAQYAMPMPNIDITAPVCAGYGFLGWYDTSASSGGTQYYSSLGTSARNFDKTTSTTLYARWGDITPPTASITSTAISKSSDQILTLSCSDNIGVTGYYYGTTAPTSNSNYITTSVDLTALANGTLTKTASNAGTYYLSCKDEAGNTNVSANTVSNVELVEYTVENMLLNVTGTKGQYSSTNYSQASIDTYIIPDASSVVASSLETKPKCNSVNQTYKGYTLTAPTASSSSLTSSNANSNITITSDKVITNWFDRTEYTLTANVVSGSNVDSITVTNQNGSSITSTSSSNNQTLTIRCGENVVATNTPTTGYVHADWKWTPSGGSETSKGHANPGTITALNANGTLTATTKEPQTEWTVTINANGTTIPVTSGWTNGSGNTTATKLVEYDSPYGTFPTLTRHGYVFVNWEDDNHNVITEDTLVSISDDHTITAVWKEGYIHKADLSCSGSNIIDTGVKLFNNDNWQKNFIMKFEIKNDSSVDTMATPMSAKKEYETPWPGVEFRHSGNLNYFRSKAAKSSSSSNEIKNIPAATKFVKFIRINNVLYYSFDNSAWTEMLDFSGFNLQFEIPTTFCASLNANSNPQRYFIGTLSDILIDFLDTSTTLSDYTNITINLDSRGATTSGSTSVNATYGSAMPSITLPTKTDYVFKGYYTGVNGTGTKYYNSDGSSALKCGLLPGDTLYAHWAEAGGIVLVGNIKYETLASAIAQGVPTNGEKTLVTLLDDIDSENVTIPSTKNVELNLGGHTLSASSGNIITNKGILEVRNGYITRNGNADSKKVIYNDSGAELTITSGELKANASINVIENLGTLHINGGKLWAASIVDQGVINNQSGATIDMSAGQIVSSKRQAIYNNGGTVNISGTAYLENGISSTANRSCLQNVSGTIIITGGTIISGVTNTDYAAVDNNGTMRIGTDDSTIDSTTPVIQGNTYGLLIKSGKTVNFYDGIIKGKISAVNEDSRLNINTNTSQKAYGTEGQYSTEYLEAIGNNE